jgi:hypothetical protein
MSPRKTVFIAAALAVVVVSGWQYHHRQGRAQEAARLRTENDRLRLAASQRHEASLRQAGQKAMPAGAHAASSVAENPLRPETAARSVGGGDLPAPATDYRDEGQGTPTGALQTFAWACDHGDAPRMEKLIVFDPAARTKAVAHLNSLPADARARWTTPEAMAAALLVADGMDHPWPSAAILQLAQTEQISPERVVLHLQGASRDRAEYQKTAEGWKYAISEPMVDAYLRRQSPGGG